MSASSMLAESTAGSNGTSSRLQSVDNALSGVITSLEKEQELKKVPLPPSTGLVA